MGLVDEMCTVELTAGRLRVVAPPMRFVFVMKLEAARAADVSDLRRLWPLTGFASPEEAVELWEAAYPLNDPDPHLVEFVRSVVSGKP